MSDDTEITASVLCGCGAVYDVHWTWSKLLDCIRVDGLPAVECPCGVQSDRLEHDAKYALPGESREALHEMEERQSRASLDLDARLEIAKRDTELRRRAEETLDLWACDGCGRAMRETPNVEALIVQHGKPICCDWPMHKVAAQEFAEQQPAPYLNTLRGAL